ncbi:zinc-ribbon domain-containing protein [Pseudomonas aeruginosa]
MQRCGAQVSNKAKACPSCGAKVPQERWRHRLAVCDIHRPAYRLAVWNGNRLLRRCGSVATIQSPIGSHKPY